MENEFWLTMNDGVEVYLKKWSSIDDEPKAIVQLAHGMVEHINRYNEFAAYLAEHQIVVYGNDHRGHGKTGERQGLLGYLAEHNGFHKTAEDLYTINQQIQQEYPDTPIFLLGHSMGSFLVRHYIQAHSNSIAGAILSGTGFYPKVTSYSGRKIASMLPVKKPSNLMNGIAFGTYNKRVDHLKTPFDWLTRDDDVIQAYIDDPYCGYVPTAGFFVDLMTGLSFIHNDKRNHSIRHDLPMLLISGDADPVGGYGKGVWKTAALYRKAGLIDVNVTLYEGARHEILNEINKDEVYERILHWIEQQ